MVIKITLAQERFFLLRPCLAVIIPPSKVESLASSSAAVFIANKSAAILQGRALGPMGREGIKWDERDRRYNLSGSVCNCVSGTIWQTCHYLHFDAFSARIRGLKSAPHIS